MKLKNNLKNFAKYVAKSFNKFAEKISESKEEFISKTNKNLDSKYLKQREEIKEKFESFYKRLRMLEYNLFGSGVNDILIISPKNKLNGVTHQIGDNSSSLKKFYDAVPNDNFRYERKEKYKNDDYMLLSSDAENLEIPHFNCETKELRNKFNQWINDEGVVVRNTGKQMVRNANGVSMIHTTGLNPITKTEGASIIYLEQREIKIPHYDNSIHSVKLYVNKKKVKEISPNEYIELDYNTDYLKVSVSDEWVNENDDIYISCEININIISETYSYFDENEYIVIKTPEDNLALNVIRPKIYFNVKMVYSIDNQEIDIEELEEDNSENNSFKIFKKPDGENQYESSGHWIRDLSDGDFVSNEGALITGLSAIIETNIPKEKISLFYESTLSEDYHDFPMFGNIVEENNKYRIPITLSISVNNSNTETNKENRSGVILITFSHKKEENKDLNVKYNEEEEEFLSSDSPVFSFRFIQGNSSNDSLKSDFGIFKQIHINGNGFLSESIEIGSNCHIINKNKTCLFLKDNAYSSKNPDVLVNTLNKTSSLSDVYFDVNVGVCKERRSILLLETPFSNGELHKGGNKISVLIITQKTSIIPGEQFIPVLSANTAYKKVSSIPFSKDQTSKDVYLVAPNPQYTEKVLVNQGTENEEEIEVWEKSNFQNWNPANYSSNVRFHNDGLNYPIEYNSLPPSAFDMFYKATDGITLSISKSKTTITKGVGTKLTVLPAETTKYTYYPQGASALPLDFYCEKGKWAKLTSNSSYIVDMLIYDKSSWSGESKSEDGVYKNKNFYSKSKISINENFIHGKTNFVILKKYQSKFYPQTEIGYVDPVVNDVVFNFADIREKSNLLHFSDCLYISTKDSSTDELNNSIGPYNFGNFIINNSNFNKFNKTYFIKISEILTSKAFISGMQESVAGSFFIDTDEITKDLSLIFKIGSRENNKVLCNVDLSINFNSQDESQFGTITLWTSKHDSAFKTTVRHHFSIEESSFKWNLFEGKQFDDEEDVIVNLSMEDIITYGNKINNVEDLNIYTLPLIVDFIGDDPSIVSQIIVKSYEKIHI